MKRGKGSGIVREQRGRDRSDAGQIPSSAKSSSSFKRPVDPLSNVLSLLKPNSYSFRGLDVGGEWAITFEGDVGIRCFAVHSGACWLEYENEPDPIRLVAGDIVLVSGKRTFRLQSGSNITAVEASSFFAVFAAGEVYTLAGGGGCSGVGGFFDFKDLPVGILLDLLPPIVHIGADANTSMMRLLIDRMMTEVREPQPGSALIAGHLAQTLLVEAFRLHMAERSNARVGWLFALADPQMLAAITAIHTRSSQKWTLETLAEVAGMSRSSFATRFKVSVGETPIEYLTRWRMLLAADHLLNGSMPIAVLAFNVGYDSESAFGAAFKRLVGSSPRQFTKNATKSGGIKR